MSLFKMKVPFSSHHSVGRNRFQKLPHLQEGILPDAHFRCTHGGQWIKTPSLLRSEPRATEINRKRSLIRELPCSLFRKLDTVCSIVTEQTRNCWMSPIVPSSNGSFMWLLSILHHWRLGVYMVGMADKLGLLGTHSTVQYTCVMFQTPLQNVAVLYDLNMI